MIASHVSLNQSRTVVALLPTHSLAQGLDLLHGFVSSTRALMAGLVTAPAGMLGTTLTDGNPRPPVRSSNVGRTVRVMAVDWIVVVQLFFLLLELQTQLGAEQPLHFLERDTMGAALWRVECGISHAVSKESLEAVLAISVAVFAC